MYKPNLEVTIERWWFGVIVVMAGNSIGFSLGPLPEELTMWELIRSLIYILANIAMWVWGFYHIFGWIRQKWFL